MSFRIGRVWGFPIEIDVSWFIIFALVAWTLSAGYFPQLFPDAPASINWVTGVIASLLFFASVLVHELAHSYVAIRNGLDVGGITLFLFGGVSRITREPHSPELELKMSAAGPATSVLLGVLFWGLGYGARSIGLSGHVVAAAGYLALINVILAIFNMVPGFPLDGGRVLRALLWRFTGSLERASRYASYSGQGFGYLLMVGGVLFILSGNLIGGVWFIFIGWFLVGAAQNAYQQVLLKRALSGIPIERIMQRDVPHLDPSLPLRDVVDDYLVRQDYSAYPVMEGDQLVGILTIDEVRNVPRARWDAMTAGEAATPPDEHRVIDEREDAWEALMRMMQENARRLLVVRDGRLEGVVSRDGILQVVRTKMQLEA
jgi:Zn-dependent protease/CBS domain-containing protein